MKNDLIAAIGTFFISYIIKSHNIEKGNFVIWDEAHFGKFSQSYLSRIFYFDVHPPLGKLLTALSGWIYGQSNIFTFDSSSEFPISFDYAGMRRFHAFISSFISVFGFCILRLFKISLHRSFFGSLLLTFDNGINSISRLILLDSHMLFFTSSTTFLFCFYFYQKSPNKHLTTLALGISIGCVVAVKWIGCLTTLYVGLFIGAELIYHFATSGDKMLLNFILSRIFYLINIPIITYLFTFVIHFFIAFNSSSDSASFSKEFSFRLKNNVFSQNKKYISYGKQVTIKHDNGFLHSHKHKYPDDKGIEENDAFQVTSYKHRDNNNVFYFQRLGVNEEASFIKHNDEIAILHNEAKGYLGTNHKPATIGEGLRVVAETGILHNDGVWIIEREDNKDKNVESIICNFYLKHKNTKKYLSLSGKMYPTWGFSQEEIVLAGKNQATRFYVEENIFSDEEGNELVTFKKRSFLMDIIELHIKMFNTNRNLTTDPALEPNAIESRPWEWFILRKGLRMSQWHDKLKFYMITNPLLHYSCSLSVVYSIYNFIKRILLRERLKFEGRKLMNDKTFLQKHVFPFYCLTGGFLLHYLPFFMVGRVLYFHHYFVCYFYGIIGLVYNLRKVSRKIFYCFFIANVLTYFLYSPLTYGFEKLSSIKYLQFIKTWNFV
ncbi:hypothetical protein NUSPORA_00077 [Nucleospora cyclopteri]